MQLPHSKPGENEKDGSHNVILGNDFPPSGASAGPPPEEPDFSEFMWMASEDLEAFDRKVISEIDEQFGLDSGATLGEEEEEFLQRMLEEEEERDTVYFASQQARRGDGPVIDLSNRMHGMNVSGEMVAQSNLNPHAAEFVPGQGFPDPPVAIPTAVHASAVPQPGEGGPLYCNSIPGTTLNSMPPCLHNPNVVLSQNNSHHLNQQQRYVAPMRPQLNGHNNMRRFFPNVNVPVYVSNMPVFPLMNGSPYVQAAPPQLPPPRLPNPDGDRCNDDEGYGDN